MSYQKICKECKTLFTARQSNYVFCSRECQNHHYRDYHNKYNRTYRLQHRWEIKIQAAERYAKKKKNLKCPVCHKTPMKYSNMKYPCSDCLIKQLVSADDATKRQYKQVLYWRGYDISMINEAINEINPTE